MAPTNKKCFIEEIFPACFSLQCKHSMHWKEWCCQLIGLVLWMWRHCLMPVFTLTPPRRSSCYLFVVEVRVFTLCTSMFTTLQRVHHGGWGGVSFLSTWPSSSSWKTKLHEEGGGGGRGEVRWGWGSSNLLINQQNLIKIKNKQCVPGCDWTQNPQI